MNPEVEFNISKTNRRRVQESEKDRVEKHPFEIIIHAPGRKARQRRKHDLERKALRKK